MSKKLKVRYTGRVLFQSDKTFDWSLYDNGYQGGNSLYVNTAVKTASSGDKVFCHESYAQDLYDLMESKTNGAYLPKDSIKGTVYSVTNITPVSDTRVRIDTEAGMSDTIDLSKERIFFEAYGAESAAGFVRALKSDETLSKKMVESGIVAKCPANGRLSLSEGIRHGVEREFREQIENKNANPTAYYATIKSINMGGYIADILGVSVFIPGSLAAPGVITNYSELLGKKIPVMIVNYVKGNGFIASHKKYLEYVLPNRIRTELSVGQRVCAKVTGISKNGLFVQIKDANGEFVFTGLIHRSAMSREFESNFNHSFYVEHDVLYCFIHSITEQENGSCRIVLGDKAPKTEEKEDNNNE